MDEIQDDLIGKKVKGIRPLTKKELEYEGWDDNQYVPCIEFDDGTIVFPSQDSEGNGPGSLFGKNSEGGAFSLA